MLIAFFVNTKADFLKGVTPMKKSAIQSVALLLSLVILALVPSVYADGAINWYCKNNDTHTPPTLDSQLAIIEKYDGYYLDKSADDGDKRIYLTFDAGYENGNVAKILDILKKHNAKGAFFILDNLIRRAPDLVKRMAEEGHAVCNHTKTHPDMTKIHDKALFENQLSSLEKAYFDLTGQAMEKVYRPPQGRFSEENLAYAKDLGYKTLFWSFAYADWDNAKQPSRDAAKEKILSHLHNGEVMLLHPTSATNAAILDEVLTAIEAEGYRIAPLDELWG